MPQNIALLGGTFDPVHLGHLNMAEWVCQELNLERLLLIPAAQPPHKQHALTPVEHRLEMLRRASADNELLEVSTVELEREGPSYTLHTLRHFSTVYPQAQLWWVIGMDSLLSLHRWYHYQEFPHYARLAVLPRPGEDAGPLQTYLQMHLPMFVGRMDAVTMPRLEIASSQIRHWLSTGKSCRYLLHPAVWQYIVEQGLYRASK